MSAQRWSSEAATKARAERVTSARMAAALAERETAATQAERAAAEARLDAAKAKRDAYRAAGSGR